jgi:hypothetical protein
MGKGSNLYFQQQQARQLREMERHQAAASGRPLRKLTWTERNVLGLKDEPEDRPQAPRARGTGGRRDRRPSATTLPEVAAQRSTSDDGSTSAEQRPTSGGTAGGGPGLVLDGYLVLVAWDGETLTVTARNKAAQIALRGPDHREGPLVLRADEIASTELKPATALVNGRITVRTTAGRTYPLHFRRRSNAEFARLYKALPG